VTSITENRAEELYWADTGSEQLVIPLRSVAAVGRPSVLDLRVDAAGTIFVSGPVVEFGEGVIDL
jgi:predicted PhzF superfamily epimerase YddE/YHI9